MKNFADRGITSVLDANKKGTKVELVYIHSSYREVREEEETKNIKNFKQNKRWFNQISFSVKFVTSNK